MSRRPSYRPPSRTPVQPNGLSRAPRGMLAPSRRPTNAGSPQRPPNMSPSAPNRGTPSYRPPNVPSGRSMPANIPPVLIGRSVPPSPRLPDRRQMPSYRPPNVQSGRTMPRNMRPQSIGRSVAPNPPSRGGPVPSYRPSNRRTSGGPSRGVSRSSPNTPFRWPRAPNMSPSFPGRGRSRPNFPPTSSGRGFSPFQPNTFPNRMSVPSYRPSSVPTGRGPRFNVPQTTRTGWPRGGALGRSVPPNAAQGARNTPGPNQGFYPSSGFRPPVGSNVGRAPSRAGSAGPQVGRGPASPSAPRSPPWSQGTDGAAAPSAR